MTNTQNYMEIGDRIRSAYIRAGFNRNQFSRAIDVNYTTVISWEKGLKMPSGDSLNGMAQVLGVTVDWLLNGDGEPTPARRHVTQPGYDKAAERAWDEFRRTDAALCALLTEDELAEIRDIRFRSGTPGTAFYRHIAMAKLDHREGRELLKALDADDVTPELKPGESVTLDPASRGPRQRRVRG